MDLGQKQKMLELFSGKLTSAARMYLENCTRCGVCVEACHVYASCKETRYTAVARAQNIRRLYERHFKVSGKIVPWLNEAVELDDEWMEKILETAYTCTGCRRCMTFCPFGIDTQLIQSIAKLMLIGADMEPKVLSMLADVSIMKGTNIEATKDTFAEAVHRLEAEVVEKWRGEAGSEAIPLDVEDANVLYVALAGKHSIIPAAAIMNAAGEKWSLSYFEAVNFGAFVGHPQKTKEIAQRIVDEAVRLRVKEVAICECGTAYRVMKHMTGEHPFKVITFVQLIARYLREGRVKLDKSKTSGRVTYHDPCQIRAQRRNLRRASVYPARAHGQFCRHDAQSVSQLVLRRRRRLSCDRRKGLSHEISEGQGKPGERNPCRYPLHCLRKLPQSAFGPERTLRTGSKCAVPFQYGC